MYLSFIPGGSNAGQVDGFILSRVEFDDHGVSVDHLHHLQGEDNEWLKQKRKKKNHIH